MKPKVIVVDYGIGNLLSVLRGFQVCGADVQLSSDPDTIEAADYLVLPGVGAFENGMNLLKTRGLDRAVLNYAKEDKPLMGICLGMQMLMEFSEEFGEHRGLGLIPGRVIPVPKELVDGRPHKIPHIGWNHLRTTDGNPSWEGSLLSTTPEESSVYFVHSFMAVPDDDRHQLAVCHYDGIPISAVTRKGNIYGCQFHPEKSGEIGLNMIRNFISIRSDLKNSATLSNMSKG